MSGPSADETTLLETSLEVVLDQEADAVARTMVNVTPMAL